MGKNAIETDVCIAGGGPAGMFLALLLVKRGVRVTVLESHDHFQREFRGEVLQPRFMQLMRQLKLDRYIESLPHAKIRSGSLYYKEKKAGEFSFASIVEDIPYALWMPQPVLLQALYDKARTYESFDMLFHAPVKRLIYEGGSVCGAVAERDGEELEIRAKATVGADGRFSAVRRLGGFELEYEHYPGDIVWFSMPKPDGWGDELRLKVTDGHSCIVLPKYPNLIQVGVVIPAGEWKEIREHGIEAFRDELIAANEAFRPFAEGLTDFKPFVLLQAKDFYVKRWAKDGLLLIGDAAHCASPAGAVGVSLSVTTAAVAADVLYAALQAGDVSAERLGRVQQLRDAEIRGIHKMQERAAKAMFSSSPFLRTIAPILVSLAAKTKLLPMLQRKLLLLSAPVPISESFAFDDESGS